MSKKVNLADTKSLLAKLMATENITVRHLDVRTATFNVKDRILTCPIWKDMDGFLYDLLMGHEVGHALYTPSEKFVAYNELHKMKRFGGMMTIEDARIEKKIKRTYPGLRRSFIEGYKSLLERDFFGINHMGGDTSQLNLIDRINLYFKIGSQIVVKFSHEEKTRFVNRIEKIETWEEVVKISDELYEYVKENEKDKINSQEQLKKYVRGKITPDGGMDDELSEQDFEESDDKDDSGDESGDESKDDKSGKSDDGEESDEESDDEDDSSGEDDKSGNEEKKSHQKDGGVNSAQNDESNKKDEEPESVTNNAFREKEEELLDLAGKPYIFLDLPDCDLKKTIVPVKTILDAFEKDLSRPASYSIESSKIKTYAQVSTDLLNYFKSHNSAYISLLVKEFEMRKNAKQYSRQLESKTGELDTNRLARYRFSSDIFRKVTEVPKGKSHGMIMFVDMSSSMENVMLRTMEQTVILAVFCKKVGIPFHVYGFSDNASAYGAITYVNEKFTPATASSFGLSNKNFHLKELISSEQSAKDFKRSMCMMLSFGAMYSYFGKNSEISNIVSGSVFQNKRDAAQMRLSGTPFIETLVASKKIINNFKSATHVDIVNVVYLTDGEGASDIYMPATYSRYQVYDRNINLGFVDPDTKKRVMVDQTVPGNYLQTAITRLIREITDCRHIGFYIGVQSIIDSKFNDTQLNKSLTMKEKQMISACFKEHKFFAVSNLGYDSYYYLPMTKVDSRSEDLKYQLDRQSPCFNERLTYAFLSVQRAKRTNRALISRFTSEIAT